MSGRHSSSSHHVSSSFNSNITTTINQHQPNHNHNHHTSSRLTRGTANSSPSTSVSLGQQQDMHRVPTFPIDPNLGGPSPTHNTSTSNATAGLSAPTNQPLPS